MGSVAEIINVTSSKKTKLLKISKSVYEDDCWAQFQFCF